MPLDLALRSPPTLAVAEGATTPAATTGAVVWSSTTGRLMVFNGTHWKTHRAVHVGTTAPANPQTGDVWIDTN